MSEQDLDTRIRSLVARAVADAPAAPELDRATRLEPRPARHDGHRGWWLGGGAALLAAAAAITTVVLVADTDDRISTPSATTVPPVATTTPATTPSPSTVAPPASTVPAPPPVAPFTVTEPGYVATAGSGGVTVRTLQADLVRRLAGPAAIALPVGDGRTVVQATGAAPTIWSADATTSEPVALVDAGGPIIIQDVAIVDGRPLLLFAIGDAGTSSQPDRIGVFDLASAARLPLGEREQLPAPVMPSSRLHLAANGLVVGALQAGGPLITAVPGSPADALLPALDPAAIGQTPGCEACPRLHTVAPDGSSVAWLEGDVLVTRAVTPQGFGASEQRTLPFEAFDSTDLDVFAEGLVLNRLQPPGAVANARWVLWADTSYGELEGSYTTQGPGTATGAATPELVHPTPPPATTVPEGITTTSSTAPPAPPASGGLVTAGPDGVTALAGDGTLRSLDMPAEIALGTPGGAVIFQPARSSPEDEPGDPLVWRPDGAVERLLGELPAGQSYRLYDVAAVGGVPTVLYGVRTRPADLDPTGFEEVLVALTMAPDGWRTDELGRVATWEGGYGRLSLSSAGLVVGEQSELVSHSFFSVAVPGSPAAATGSIEAASLGLDPTYGDCDCPRGFAVTGDGRTIAWIVGTEVVVHDVDGGSQESWTVPALSDLFVRSVDVRSPSDGTFEVVLNVEQFGGDPAEAVVVTLAPDGAVTSQPTSAAFASFPP